MYTFGRMGPDLLNIKHYGVRDGDTVIFCFGEIDCRNHVHKHITNRKTYKDIIDEVVIGYFEAIKGNIMQYGSIRTCVYNVVPPSRKFDCGPGHPYPFLGSDNHRKQYHIYMNAKIRELCSLNKFFYFDIYNESSDEEGFLKKEYSDGSVHLIDARTSAEVIKHNLL